jgi:CRP-like cAMP-binding protein
MKVKTTVNQLLSRIPWKEYPELADRFTKVPFEPGKVLYEAHAPMEHAYFPVSGTLSAVVVMSDGDMIEVATVGNEGAIGLPIIAAGGSSPNRVFVQVPGEGMRIEAAVLAKCIHRDGALRNLVLKYYEAFTFQVSQSVACNGLHPLAERCCRWLLMTHDRVEGDEIHLTHEFMSVMLGVRRPSVSETLQGLKDRGLITYTRGKITVLDRQGLEEGSCECYRAVRDEHERLLS